MYGKLLVIENLKMKKMLGHHLDVSLSLIHIFVLGVGRAIGETMAVIMVAGNQARMPAGIFRGVRTLTANIVIEMGYATGLHREALIATGVVLFVFILLINFCVALLKRRTSHE